MKPSDIKLFDILTEEERKARKAKLLRNCKRGDITLEELDELNAIKNDVVLGRILENLKMWFINEYETIQQINLTTNEE